MKESATYQMIVEEGRAEGAVIEARKLLRVLGDDLFGPPDARTKAAIERIGDVTRLEDLFKRARTVGSWQELIGSPPPGRRSRGRGTGR